MIHPAVRDLFLDLGRHPAYQELVRRVTGGANASLSGLTTTAKALYAVLLAQSCDRPLIIVVDGNKQAEAIAEIVQTFFGLLSADDRLAPQLLPSPDVLPLQNLSPHAEICEQRAIGLWRLATQKVPITILPVASALLRVEGGDFFRQLALRLKVGEELPLDEVVAHLESIGYERREPVEMVGEYSVRGGILDVFSPEAQRPVRIDLFGDLVESIRRFDVESQRSVLKIEECTLLPLTEYQQSRELLAHLADLVREADIPGARPASSRRAVSGVGVVGADAAAAPGFGAGAGGSAGGAVGRTGAGARGGRTVVETAWSKRRSRRPTTRSASSSAGRNWNARRRRVRRCRLKNWKSPGRRGMTARDYICRRGRR